MGGLGNQMFQYAFGRSLANKFRKKLVLDVDFLLDRTPKLNFVFRDFDLDIFRLNTFDFFNAEMKEKFRKKKMFSKGTVHLIEEGFHFQDFVELNKFSRFYLDGYWQSYKYFQEIQDVIKHEFQFLEPLNPVQQDLLNRIHATKSICINFRRADFVSIASAIQTHGTPTLKYYHDALTFLINTIGQDIELFIFSDDVEWCRTNFKTNYPMFFVDHQTYKGDRFSAYLNLMTNCKHFIIPNSTFAWWGAWLASNPSKCVITPEKWFADEKLQSQTQDLRPSSWLMLS